MTPTLEARSERTKKARVSTASRSEKEKRTKETKTLRKKHQKITIKNYIQNHFKKYDLMHDRILTRTAT